MEYIPLSPLFIGLHTVSDDLIKVTQSKVAEYLSNNILTSPTNELVKSTYHTGKNFLDDADLVELKQEIINCSTEFLKQLKYDFNKPINITSWMNVFAKDVMEAEHTHYNSILSGCYYVDSEGTENSGNFYITDQIPQREQNRTYYKLLKQDMHSINPAPGAMVLFESWVRHGVFANKTDKPRISIAFNID